MAERGLRQEDLAAQIPAGAGTVNAWLKDGAMPGGRHMVRLPEVLGVSGHWLLTGQGPKDLPMTPDPAIAAIDTTTKRIAEVVASIRREVGLPISAAPGADAGDSVDVLQRLEESQRLQQGREEGRQDPGGQRRPG